MSNNLSKILEIFKSGVGKVVIPVSLKYRLLAMPHKFSQNH
jgi:hypothetical protein